MGQDLPIGGGGRTTGTNQHVVIHERGWAVRAEGADLPARVFKTQSEAWEKAKSLARKERSEALLHGRDGVVRERNIYGHDLGRAGRRPA
jgi:hypothetical protein